MKPVSTQLLFDHCYGQYAIAAVNVFTMEQVHGLFQAAQHTASPVIVQVTPVARNFAHPLMMMNMIKAAAEIYPDVVYAIHLDHGTEAHAFAAIDEGYTSVMIDASHDVFDKNVARTKTIVEKAHAKGIVVEAELGVLSGVEDDLVVDESHSKYTDPVQAKQFVQLTGCDSLAVAVGTSHGAYKFSGSRGLQFNVLKAIQEQLPGYPLVLHGASSVKKEDVIAINKMGGQLADHASGVSDEEVRKAIQYGVCKVNIATDLRLLWTKVYRSFFYHHPEQFDPLVPGKEYIEAYKQFMIEKLELLGATGKSVIIQFN
ncbi:MAG: class II fructose-bisphosphate aldolase [Bacteroidota bacterium]|nr:class II fructose-bisphosphate aldolase [Bacteroidota bacterium]